MYLPRYLEKKLHDLSRAFKVILVTGPRQAGKSTLLGRYSAELFGSAGRTISFDTPSETESFRSDPDLFFQNNPGPLFLDEVQHVPDLLPYLKREVDRAPRGVRYLLSGSQHFPLMKGVTESLAGRVAVLDLWPLATQEIRSGLIAETVDLLEEPARLEEFRGRDFPASDPEDVVPLMLQGGYPGVALEGGGSDWLESYRRTLLQRDIRDLSQVADLGRFDRFVLLSAGRTGCEINRSELGRTLGIDHKTIDHWWSLLESTYQSLTLPSYHVNATKRVVKRPKWLFADIGLALHLQAIRTSEALLRAPHFGRLFETWVIMEIRKLFGHAARPWAGHFFRTSTRKECDLVLPAGGRLVPIEIKHTSRVRFADLDGLREFRDQYADATDLALCISMNPRVEELQPGVFNLPIGLLLNGPGSG